MGFLKKAVFGMGFMFFLFIGLSFLSEAGINIFAEGFMGVGGLMLLLSIGAVETNFVFFE